MDDRMNREEPLREASHDGADAFADDGPWDFPLSTRDAAAQADELMGSALGAEKGAEVALHFDGENSYPECRRCGSCCQVNVLAMTHEEVERIRAYIAAHDIHPIDRHKQSCCLEAADGQGCMVWEARAQVCRLHNCHVSRIEILRRNPSIRVPEDIPLVDLHECFINGREIDPRYANMDDPASDAGVAGGAGDVSAAVETEAAGAVGASTGEAAIVTSAAASIR